MHPVFMIGWDGATFDLIRPWVDQGHLPNLAQFMKEGVQGPLQSTIPAWSFQAWSSFLTGKNPGKHGVFDFFRTRPCSYELEFVDSDHRRGGPSVWEILSDAGRNVVSISIPCTFPPEPVNGVMISGFDFPGEGPGSFVRANGMHPRELYGELARNVGLHPIDAPILKELGRGDFRLALERILETIRGRAATAKYLMRHRPWDCFMVVFGESDTVSHHFWQFCDPSSPFFADNHPELRDSILRVYQELDRQLGEFMEMLPSDTTVLVLSDHGCGGISDWTIFPNCWLNEKRYLRFRGRGAHGLSRLRQAAKHWGLSNFPTWFQRLLYRSPWNTLGRFESRVRYGMIDWDHTRAYFDENPYFPVIRVNVQGRQPKGIVKSGREYEEVRDTLIRELQSWRHPETGEPIVEKAYRREEIYSGQYLEEAADVVPKWALHRNQNYGFQLSSKSRDLAWITRLDPHDRRQPFFPKKFSSHRDYGIFLARGPELVRGATVSAAQIIDVAPTVLSLLDVPIPKDMDGRVLQEILRNEAVSVPSRANDGP